MDKAKLEIRISKFMSWLLRHGIDERKLEMDSDGFILLDDLMNQGEMKSVSIDDVQHIVDTNDKKRFTIEERIKG